MSEQLQATPLAAAPTLLDDESTRISVMAAGLAAYRWDIATDHLAWSADTPQVLRRHADTISTGKRFASLLDPENLTSRYDTVMNGASSDQGQGVAYQIEYQLKADEALGYEATWLEDTGRWFADRDGRPAYAVGIVRQVTARHLRDQHLSELSHTDTLTGLMNRNRLDEALEESIAQAIVGSSNCAFAVASIRNLDIVNDAYGFDVADEVIAAVALRLRGVMRVGDGIGRYSGSKFGIILNACSDSELPRALERFLNTARDSVIETTKGPVWVLLSIGAVCLPLHAQTSTAAKALAEESLSAALRLSSDSHVIFSPSRSLTEQRMVDARCAAEIVECLKNNRFKLAFQPIVSAETGEVTCHEALLRMRDEAGELVTAGHLVPVAERLGLIRLVDRCVVQLALEVLHTHPGARLSINISATTANDPRWNAQIIEMIEASAEVADRLTIEITETSALTDLTSALLFLEKIRAAGCCVAIDDFGAGFTSFRNLRDLPIDVIKLDGSYCRNLTTDSENVYFARTLIDMAHHFGIRTVAEWVETETDSTVLTSLGIDFLQGNFLGLPDVTPPWTVSSANSFIFEDETATSPVPQERMDEAATPESPGPVAAPPEALEVPEAAEESFEIMALAPYPEAVVELPQVTVDEPPPTQMQEVEVSVAAESEGSRDIEEVGIHFETVTLEMSELSGAADAESQAFSEDTVFADVDESLAKLKDTLDLLTRQFGEPFEQRIAV
jgi:diguanylate cyclase (GGDEF)-like protein